MAVPPASKPLFGNIGKSGMGHERVLVNTPSVWICSRWIPSLDFPPLIPHGTKPQGHSRSSDALFSLEIVINIRNASRADRGEAAFVEEGRTGLNELFSSLLTSDIDFSLTNVA